MLKAECRLLQSVYLTFELCTAHRPYASFQQACLLDSYILIVTAEALMSKSNTSKKGLRIIIVGCGKVGINTYPSSLRRKDLSHITLIDKNAQKLQSTAGMYDVMGVVGNGCVARQCPGRSRNSFSQLNHSRYGFRRAESPALYQRQSA